ncbi:MAG TPA: TonB-dependent receptor [Candidatus Udaeobacter sp.]|nr:TonB-dependent receptor [Candidatus Udaeobacter sp.]
MTKNALKTFRFVRLALMAGVGFPFIIASNAFAQLPAPAEPAPPPPGAPAPASAAEVERVVVTGSNIPTAEETGPNPVDTYRPQDIEKLGIRSATDLQEFIPQEAGGTVNLNIGNAGDGTVQFNLRGLLPKETLVLIDGKRVAYGSLAGAGTSGGPDINLIPFSMVDHVDILKDGASAVYGSDAIAGVVNFFLIHKFRGLEIGATYGNTNLGASNEMGEWESWIKAGTGDDKTDIVVIADFWERLGGVFSRDRDIASNGDFTRFGGNNPRSSNFPGAITTAGTRLIPSLFFAPPGLPQFGVNTPPAHSAPNRQTSPFYNGLVPGPINNNGFQTVVFNHTNVGFGSPQVLDGNYVLFNFAAFTPALPPGDRQVYYGSFTRDICDKYLTIFADFKVARSYFDASLAAVPFTPDPFKVPGSNVGFSPQGISVPIANPFNPFTVADRILDINGVGVPVTTGVKFRGINDTGPRHEQFTYNDYLFDVGLRGEMGEIADYFKTWNWETGFRYSRNEGKDISIGEVSQPGLRDALLSTDLATAFDPFFGINGHNSRAARAGVYVNLQNTGEYELPIYYATINGDLFSLPAGPISFAIGGEYDAPRFTRDRDPLNNTFQSIGSVDGQSYRVNRDIWAVYEEVRVPFTSPTWNFPGFYSFEVDFAEREEWYSNNTSTVLVPFQPAVHSRYNAQKPKVSVRWQPLDPKYIGAVTLRGSYTEAFHAPTLSELTPAGSQNFPLVVDPFTVTNPVQFRTQPQIEERIAGNPNLHPEVAYEWTYGAVWSPKWVKGLTLSADYWHIDMRDLVTVLGAQFIIQNSNRAPFDALVTRDAPPPGGVFGPVTLVQDPSFNVAGAIFEGLDYEAIYILDSTIFGGSDWGRVTTTINGTHLFRAELQPTPDSKRFGIGGQFIPTSFTLTSSLPWDRANFSIFYDGPADTWAGGLDVGAVVHWIGQFEDDNFDLTAASKPQEPRSGAFPDRARKVAMWTTLDLILNYTFNLPPPPAAEVPGYAKDGGKNVKSGKDGKEKNVIPVSTAEYGCNNWRWWLNNTTVTLGLQNVTDEDPPFVAGSFENGYDESIATIKGRFWYVGLKKRF